LPRVPSGLREENHSPKFPMVFVRCFEKILGDALSTKVAPLVAAPIFAKKPGGAYRAGKWWI
jgi:hypothetical protein